jgi:beta-N-acetylhexosaminidase
MIMTAHIVFPALNGGTDVPATLSAPILKGLLRKRLGFRGVIVTDAMDMHAIHQGPGLVVDTMAALAAGVDLLLFNHDLAKEEEAFGALLLAVRRGLLPAEGVRASAARVLDLKKWLRGRKPPPLEVIGCPRHRDLARQVAQRSVTLVKDEGGLLPLRLDPSARVAAVVPRPEDLTPADTSSLVVPELARALGRHHPRVEETFIGMNPSAEEAKTLAARLAGVDLAVVGTINATGHPGQAALVRALVEQGTPTVAVALRMPYDIAAYPAAPTYACTYSILPPSMDALADALFGRIPFAGRLPVRIPRS